MNFDKSFSENSGSTQLTAHFHQLPDAGKALLEKDLGSFPSFFRIFVVLEFK